MCSIHKLRGPGRLFSLWRFPRWAAALALAGAPLLGGCANIHDNPPARLSERPLRVDEAMQQRDWTPTVALYANGSVVAPPTYYPYVARDDTNAWLRPFVESGLFLGQTVALPVTLIVAENPQVYSGVITPPTYTAVPPIETVP
jgi:hypothetical protein